MWANSTALDIAGVGRDTPDPIPGFSYYVRDEHGDPTGYLLEVDTVLSLVNAVDPISPHSMQTLLESWLPKASAAGITSVFDAGGAADRRGSGRIDRPVHRSGAARRAAFRVVASYSVKAPPVDDAVAKLTDIRNRISTELVTVGAVKIIGDGTQVDTPRG